LFCDSYDNALMSDSEIGENAIKINNYRPFGFPDEQFDIAQDLFDKNFSIIFNQRLFRIMEKALIYFRVLNYWDTFLLWSQLYGH